MCRMANSLPAVHINKAKVEIAVCSEGYVNGAINLLRKCNVDTAEHQALVALLEKCKTSLNQVSATLSASNNACCEQRVSASLEVGSSRRFTRQRRQPVSTSAARPVAGRNPWQQGRCSTARTCRWRNTWRCSTSGPARQVWRRRRTTSACHLPPSSSGISTPGTFVPGSYCKHRLYWAALARWCRSTSPWWSVPSITVDVTARSDGFSVYTSQRSAMASFNWYVGVTPEPCCRSSGASSLKAPPCGQTNGVHMPNWGRSVMFTKR